jgi:hypothetical protein
VNFSRENFKVDGSSKTVILYPSPFPPWFKLTMQQKEFNPYPGKEKPNI